MTPANYSRRLKGFRRKMKFHYEGFALLAQINSNNQINMRDLIRDRFEKPILRDVTEQDMEKMRKLGNADRS